MFLSLIPLWRGEKIITPDDFLGIFAAWRETFLFFGFLLNLSKTSKAQSMDENEIGKDRGDKEQAHRRPECRDQLALLEQHLFCIGFEREDTGDRRPAAG